MATSPPPGPSPPVTGLASPPGDAPVSGSASPSPHLGSPQPPPELDYPPPPGDGLPPSEYIEPGPDELLPPPNFSPFFTLIEDTTTGEHYHPDVHYIFASDDQDIVTAASIRSLGGDDRKRVRAANHNPLDEDADQQPPSDAGGAPTPGEQSNPHDEIIESSLPPPRSGVNERYILLDVAADGNTILDAQSLSKKWQITRTQVRAAPTWDGDEADGGALMLMVEGVEVKVDKGGAATAATTAAGAATATASKSADKLFSEERRNAGGDAIAGMELIVQRLEKEAEIANSVMGSLEYATATATATTAATATITATTAGASTAGMASGAVSTTAPTASGNDEVRS